jgi:hypothetical protein
MNQTFGLEQRRPEVRNISLRQEANMPVQALRPYGQPDVLQRLEISNAEKLELETGGAAEAEAEADEEEEVEMGRS